MGGYLHLSLATCGAGAAVAGAVCSLAAATGGGGASRAAGISLRGLAGQRLARKPKWRTRMKPLGRTWSRKRRTSSSQSAPADACPGTRAVAGSVGIRCTEKALQKAANHSARQAGIMQRLGTHTLRYTPLSARRLAKMA